MKFERIQRRKPGRLAAGQRTGEVNCERLEARRLFAATVTSAIPSVLGHPGSAASDSLDLSQFFNDPNIFGTVVAISTTAGSINVTLTDGATPITVQNFLSYVNSGDYNNTFFHRSAVFSNPETGGSPSNPADIVQGGGFFVTSSNGISAVTSKGTIQDEFDQELFGDEAGTIAAANTGDANSASNEFFFNAHDNTGTLDSPNLRYTTFGRILGNGLSVVNTLAALPTANLSSVNSALTEVPVSGDTTNGVTANSLEYINSAKVVPGFTYTITSDNTALVQPTVSGSTLSFTYGAGLSGVANITITAASADGVSLVSQTFALTVPNTAQPPQGPTANADVAPDILHDTTGIFHPLANDTDSLAALLPSSVQITTQPTNGTATIDPATGYITYVPNAGFIGADSLQYTVRDVNGSTSAPGTMAINVTPDPRQVTIGGATRHDLNYTQPDGTVAHLSVVGGTAVVTFHNYNVQVSTSGTHMIASGPGATITGITVTTPGHQAVSFSLTAKSGIPILGGLSAADVIFSQISAPTANLTGALTVTAAGRFILGTATGADISIGSTTALISINSATNTNLKNGGGILALRTKQWTDPGGGHSITTGFIGSLVATGAFSESLDLNNLNVAPINANIGQLTGGTWKFSGYAKSISAKTVDPSWSLSSNNLVSAIKFGGDLASNIATGAIGSLTVGGSIKNAVIEMDAGWTAKFVQLLRLKAGGTITNSKIVAQGNIGSVVATGIVDSSILAGLGSTIIQGSALPTSHNDFTAPFARIQSVQVGAKGTFSNSRILAGAIGSMQLGNVTTKNNSTAFGIAGATMGAINCVLDGTTKLVLGKAQLSTGFTLAVYLSDKKITLNDFDIEFVT